MHQNIQSVKAHKNELEILLQDNFNNRVQILCLSEHWLNKYDTISLAHYKLATVYCRKNNKLGGVCIFVRDTLEYSELEVDEWCEEKIFECCGIKFKISDIGTVHLFCLYRTPSKINSELNLFFDKLESLLSSFTQSTTNVILCGDINIDVLNSRYKYTQILDSLCKSFNLKILINEPTRVTDNNATCLDNFFTNLNEMCTTAVVFEAALSDHKGQVLSVVNREKCRIFTNFTYKRVINLQKLNTLENSLQYETWNFLEESKTVDEAYNSFYSTFFSHYNVFCPKRKYKNKKVNSWITKGIKVSSAKKRVLYNQIKNGREDLWNYYKQYKYILKKVITAAKKLHNDKIIATGQKCNVSRTVWNIVNAETGKGRCNTRTNLELFDKNGILISDPGQLATNLNQYYVETNKLLQSCSKVQPAFLDKLQLTDTDSTSMFLTPVIEEDVIKYIAKLKNKISFGLDEVQVAAVKHNAHLLCKPLCKIINMCFEQGQFPSNLKDAKVIPIYKKGDANNMKNYRPISLLSVFSKIFELILNDRLLSYFHTKQYFVKNQHGFRKNKSTTTAIYQLVQSILESHDNNIYTLAIFCDLTKAFDCIDHEILLEKLQYYGVRGSTLSLFRSYLKNRKQVVEIIKFSNGTSTTHRSDFIEIESGVPQGSILGPTLFLIYINDLSKFILPANSVLYADDTTILLTESNIKNLFHLGGETMERLHEWFTANKLNLNESKTYCTVFGKGALGICPGEKLKLGRFLINYKEVVTFLGTEIDNKLNWACHIHTVCQKLASACYALRILKSLVSHHTLLMAYHGYFCSIMSYAISIWGGSSNYQRVFKLQKKAIRIVFGLNQRESCRTIFTENKIMTMPCLYIYETLIFTKRNLKTYKINTISSRTIQIQYPRHNSKKFENSPWYTGAKLFNKLPNNIKNISETYLFKNAVKNLLLLHGFYSRAEYQEASL